MTNVNGDVKLTFILCLVLWLAKIGESSGIASERRLQRYVTIQASNCPSRQVLIAQREPQYISSPNYPGHYGTLGGRLSCSWVIYANATYDDVVIEMLVHNSSLEPATGCWRDVVEVLDGTRDFHPSLKSWCGSSGPSGTFTTSGSVGYVKFSTNFKDNDYYGFLMSFWVVKKHKYTVNVQPWTKVNYVLFGISMILVGSIPITLTIIAIVRAVQARNQDKMEKKT